MSARMGYCPALPAPQLALARLADRIRTGLGQAGAVFRSHPAASTVPLMVVSAGAIAFLLLATVGAPAGVAPVPGELIPAVAARPVSELLAPAPRQSIGVAAFTPQPTAAGRTLSDSTPPPAP